MVEDERFTNVQEENIYSVIQEDNDDDIAKNVCLFFSELYDRRRNDYVEGGVQACITILPDKCAMKVCEKDGMAPHINSIVNSIKYLNGDNNYISVVGTGYLNIYKSEREQLYDSGVEVRFLAGDDNLMIVISSEMKAEAMSQFQLKLLNLVLLNSKVCKDSALFSSVEMGFNTWFGNFDVGDLSDEYYITLCDIINDARKGLMNKSSFSR